MPSMYELSEEECTEIARALMCWLKMRIRKDSSLSDWDLLQVIKKLGREEDVDVEKR